MDVEKGVGRIDVSLRTRLRSEVVVFGKLMAALAMMKSKDVLNVFQVEVYEDATADVPLHVMAMAVSRYMQTPNTWRPDPGDLVAACEAIRLEIRGAEKFEPCEQCSTDGWVSREVDGVMRMVRCLCWKAHQARLKALGMPDKPLALPPAEPSREFSRVGEE